MSTNADDPTGKQFTLDFGSGNDPFNAITYQEKEISTSEDLPDDDTPLQTDTIDEADEDHRDPVTSEEEEEIDEEDDVSIDEGDSSDDEDLNIYYHIASDLKQDTFLPEDFEVSKDIDGTGLKQAIKSKLRDELTPGVEQELYQAMQSKGYNEHDLVIARALRQGVDPRLLSTASMYETYASMSDDIDISQKEAVISQMYRSRDFHENEILNQISIAKKAGEDEDDLSKLEELYQESKRFFKGKYEEFVNQENERNDELESQAAENARKANELINGIIGNKSIGGYGMTAEQAKEFESSIRKPNVIEIDGQKYQATELQKFLYDFQINDEIKLLTFFLHKFRDQQKEQIKKQVKKEVEEEFMGEYKQKIIKKNNKASKNNKVIKEELQRQSNQFVLDFSKQR